MSDDLSAFDAKASDSVEPDALSLEVERFMHNVLPHIFPTQAKQIIAKIYALEIIPPAEVAEDIGYGAGFDMTAEVEGLIKSVRAMRSVVMDDSGRVKEGITPKELKETVTATTSLMNLLMKSHEKLMNFDRMRALEQTTVDTLRELGGEEIVSRFVELMESRLEES